MKQPDKQGLPLRFYLRDDGETIAVLLREIKYLTSMGYVTVPAGFESDGCSMPRFFWRVFGHPFSMAFLREAILHDWLYREQPCDRLAADRIFREELTESADRRRMAIRIKLNMDRPYISDKAFDKEYQRRIRKADILSGWQIFCIYAGLRWFGGYAWERNKRKKETK
jgi:hypothetical protein